MQTVPHHFRASGAGASRPKLRAVLPLVWELVRPRRGLLAFGFVLMAINRVASPVLPYSTRFLIDNVITKHQIGLLKPIVFGVLAATLPGYLVPRLVREVAGAPAKVTLPPRFAEK